MTARHLLTIEELGAENLSDVLNLAFSIARSREAFARALEGKLVGIYFRRTSTRTRTSFTVGALRLGAATISYGPHDLQLATGETVRDTARVLAGFGVNALVIRTNDSLAEMREFAAQDEMSIINAMSTNEHPTQAIADLVTMQEEFGRLQDMHILYLGEGNNTAASLALAVAQTPAMRLTLVTPEGYGLPADLLHTCANFAARSGSQVVQHHDMNRLPAPVDVVYTTRWQTMGEPKADGNWRQKFEPYKITSDVMAQVSSPSTIFMHDLPAMRGMEIVDEVLDGPQSRAFLQARHKLTSAMASLAWCVGINDQ
jgi:ornithine carbamoyltransferase